VTGGEASIGARSQLALEAHLPSSLEIQATPAFGQPALLALSASMDAARRAAVQVQW